jgi:2-polyprenyl-6-methoxyphenol hydroxylase-like FAD-dependent oxidoreductase
MYDAIIVGARVAGAATAMLLARKGLRVLAVDRASFPSDTLSTHQIQVPGVAKLYEWGLLDRVVASGAPATRQVRFDYAGSAASPASGPGTAVDPGPAVLAGRFPEYRGVDALYSPRRTVLDKILVDAAREAGAEVRENFIVEQVGLAPGRVTGREKGGARVTESARLIIGADGKHSLVAQTAGAAVTGAKPVLSMACYSYWEGVPLTGGELCGRDRRALGAWPTNDGLTMVYQAWPIAEFESFRGDVEGNAMRTIDAGGELGERIRAGRRVERFRATPDLPNVVRKPYGPGWALVGDAGLVLDPITGQGIGHAFRDAQLLADAVSSGRPLHRALARYERVRNRATLPMFDFTAQLAALAPPGPEAALFAALAGRQEEIDRFFAMLAGVLPVKRFFSPPNLVRLVGLRGFARLAAGQRRPAPSPA